MPIEWTCGNRFELLENGEEFYPRALRAIAAAEREVLLETFILFEDKVGLQFHRALIDAARRGVRVAITVDGFGSPAFSDGFILALRDAGVEFREFDPCARLFGLRTSIFRRLHRKILAIDERLAFVGGINLAADHLADFGPMAKQDYAVAIEGPLAKQIHHFARWLGLARPGAESIAPDRAGPGRAAFVFRDNGRHRNDIERQYLAAIRRASREIVIANAYFFPAWRVLNALRNAARRGVAVRLILQGQPDMPSVRFATRQLYDFLLSHGVQIFEYLERPLHAKVALVDDDWATVGSSNLDPLSLWFNLEANVLIADRDFNRELRDRLQRLLEASCRRVEFDPARRARFWRLPLVFAMFHLVRRFPRLLGWLPAHRPRIRPITPTAVPAATFETVEPAGAGRRTESTATEHAP